MTLRTPADQPGRRELPASTQRSIRDFEDALGRLHNGEDAHDAVAAAVDAAVRSATPRSRSYDDPFQLATDLLTVVADNLRELREEAGWTQAQLAEAMQRAGFDWKRITVTEIEGTTRKVSFEELLVLAALYAVPMLSFFVHHTDDLIEINDVLGYADSVVVRELMLGRGGHLGDGGTLWGAAIAVAGRPKGRKDIRPAVDLWRNRHNTANRIGEPDTRERHDDKT
jgi:transcriptional regulator with XRE-family HTH domain